MRRLFFIITALLIFCAAAAAEEPGKELSVSAGRLNLRSGPGLSHEVLGTLAYGDRAKILGREKGWLRISHGDKDGWVKDSPAYVSTGGDSEDSNPFARRELALEKGEQTVIRVPGATRATMGAAGIVAARFLGDGQVLLTGSDLGRTDLIFWAGELRLSTVDVEVKPSLSRLAANLTELLSNVENLTVRVLGDKIVLDGDLLTLKDMRRVSGIAEAYGKRNIVNLTTLDRGEKNQVVADFIADTAGMDTVNVKILEDTAFLKGVIFSEHQRKHLVEVAKTQVENVVDLLVLREIMIDTEVMFVQVEKNDGESFGQNLFDGNGGATAATYTLSGKGTKGGFGTWDITADWTANLLSFLTLQESKGLAKLIQRPHLSTKSGEKGYFHSGGEYYFEVSGVQTAQLQDVNYGLQLTVTPLFKSKDELIVTVRIEISVPVASSGTEVLNLDKFVTENTVLCKLGQSILISGIIQKLKNHYKARTPFLGDIPLLSLFFAAKNDSSSNKELVAIITPQVLNMPAGLQDAGGESPELAAFSGLKMEAEAELLRGFPSGKQEQAAEGEAPEPRP